MLEPLFLLLLLFETKFCLKFLLESFNVTENTAI